MGIIAARYFEPASSKPASARQERRPGNKSNMLVREFHPEKAQLWTDHLMQYITRLAISGQ